MNSIRFTPCLPFLLAISAAAGVNERAATPLANSGGAVAAPATAMGMPMARGMLDAAGAAAETVSLKPDAAESDAAKIDFAAPHSITELQTAPDSTWSPAAASRRASGLSAPGVVRPVAQPKPSVPPSPSVSADRQRRRESIVATVLVILVMAASVAAFWTMMSAVGEIIRIGDEQVQAAIAETMRED